MSAPSRPPSPGGRVQVTVVVLGDLGRSPRMLYQTLALARDLAEVDLVGYRESELPDELTRHPHVEVHALPVPPVLDSRRRLRFWLGGLLRLGRQSVELLGLLSRVRKPGVVLVQNPPSLPTLALAVWVSRRRRARLVIDWHNLGYTVLALKLGPRHLLVRAAAWYEGRLGRLAQAHLCVSKAMARHLEQWGLAPVAVLYDRPAEGFRPTSLAARHDLFRRLGHLWTDGDGPTNAPHGGPCPAVSAGAGQDQPDLEPTPFTRLQGPRDGLRGEVGGDGELDSPPSLRASPCRDLAPSFELRADRPGLLVSPTSWSADEDFSLLVDAVAVYEEAVARPSSAGRFPDLVVLLTGKGPLRSHYEARFRRLALERVRLLTLWLSPRDYPRLLGAADLGLCFHRSSSGLDLPMKLADMLGAGLPVCALDYGPVLGERLRSGRDGLLFTSGEELGRLLVSLFRDFPAPDSGIEVLGRAVRGSRRQGFSWGWHNEARPTFEALVGRRASAEGGEAP